ncbi:MAG TPA: hypothetical protein HPP80_00320 [Rhodospirillaceae bacterium]|nr:hypothetical protein [Rhodospirillaceae bacterium]
MARKPNYNYDRMERDRAKKERLAAKAKSKSEERALQKIGGLSVDRRDGDDLPEAEPAN